MDYEKKYKEAIELARDYYKANQKIGKLEENEVLSDIFPELQESEDERIRKALIDGFTVMKESKNCGKTFSNHNIPVVDILAWLEKQGEQKPTLRERYDNIAKSEWFKKTHEGMSISDEETKWSEEDDDDAWLNDIVSKAENGCLFNRAEIDWLKSIKEKLHKQKPKWTEEDERNLTIVEEYLDGFQDFMEEISALIDWLKSLKQRMEQ